jgi:hypothetical protein
MAAAALGLMKVVSEVILSLERHVQLVGIADWNARWNAHVKNLPIPHISGALMKFPCFRMPVRN